MIVQARVEAMTPGPAAGFDPGPARLIQLRVPGHFHFRPGQYLEVVLSGGSLPLSIASGPGRLPLLYLLYQSTTGDRLAGQLDQALRNADELNLAGPFGDVILDPAYPEPLMLIAAGTGGAQALAMLDALAAATAVPGESAASREASAAQADPADMAPAIDFLWCTGDPALFASARPLMPTRGAGHLARLSEHWFVDPTRGPNNAGLRWLAEHAPALRDRRFILCGPPAFVAGVTQLLLDAAVPRGQLQSDMYAFM